MPNKREIFSWAGILLSGLILIGALFPHTARADGQELKTVRVGFFAFDGYHTVDEDGARGGYGYELLQRMAGYTNWQYAYVGYDKSWSQMQDMLARGEIDLLTSAQKTDARAARFDFSDESIGTSSAILTVKAGNTAYAAGDYADWNGIRVGMIDGNSRNADFTAFAEKHGFAFASVQFDDTETMVAALKTGESIDAILTSSLRKIDGEWILAEFDASPFYIMVRKGDDALLSEVNSALASLSADEPEFRTELMHKYYTPDSGGEIAFTASERAFIEEMRGRPVTVAVNPDRAPLSTFAGETPVGIVVEIAKAIAERSGLDIRIVQTADRAEYRKLVESGGVDVCFDARDDFGTAEALGYRLTDAYLDVTVSRLYRKDKTAFNSAAMLEDMDVSAKNLALIRQKYANVVYYGTVEELTEAILSGSRDVAYLYGSSAELAVQDDVTNRLVSETLYGYDVPLSIAVNARQDRRLFSILNKAAASMRQGEIEEIVQRYTEKREKPFTLIGYMYDYPVHVVTFVAAVFIFAALIIASVAQSKKRKREYAELLEEKRRGELLSDALTAAELAGAAKSQFLSRVSHEMRTPLNAIIGFMELAKDAEPQQAEVYRTNAGIAAKQLLSVINDVLDMSSIESGKMKIAHAPFNFKRTVHDVTNIYLAQCSQKGLAYETKLLTPMEEWLVGDQLRVSQILLNLLSNAYKFTTTGHIYLEISQTEVKADSVFIRFEVADTGCGMSEEMLNRLFQPFEQQSAATAQRYGGNGLGLSIVKNLVNMMGGAIRVKSREGEGTTFTVDLPFGRSTEAKYQPQLPDDSGELFVLTVDDEPREREYLSAMLTRLGVRHTGVASGDEALRELARADGAGDPYNVCLIDWKMPKMSGIETTKRIREKYGKDVIVIVASAYEHHQADADAEAAGANMFLTKPLFQSSLFDLFMTLTGGRIGKRAAKTQDIRFSGKRVLVAEDNAMNRLVATGLIEKYGIVCDTAADGRIAVDKFLSSAPGTYDAILMDIQMPNMDGFAATREIRTSAHPDAKTIPIIALTANAFNEDIAKSLSVGMNDHIAKPIEPEMLKKSLERAFAAPR